MAILRLVNTAGDKVLTWDQEKVEAGDPEARRAVREAERIFNELTSRGGTALAVAPDRTTEHLEKFNPKVEESIILSPITGG